MVENEVTEFKSIWKDEWLEWICGFANQKGGSLFIGYMMMELYVA